MEYSPIFFYDINKHDPWRAKFLDLYHWIEDNEMLPTKTRTPGSIFYFYRNNGVLLRDGKLDDNKARLLLELGIIIPDQRALDNKRNKVWYNMFFRYLYWKNESEVSYVELYDIDRVLHGWIRNTKKFYTQHIKMNDVKISLLDRVDFGKSKHNYSFDENVEALLLYKERFGSVHVRQDRGPYYGLSRWVNTLRSKNKLGVLEHHKVDRLNKIGFIWDMEIYKFQQKVDKLKKFYDEHKHFNVSTYTDFSLSQWVSSMRCRPPIEGKMRILLDEINFDWKSPELKTEFE